MVPRIGEVEECLRDPSVTGPNGQLGGWGMEIADIGIRIAEERSKTEQSVEERPIKRPQKGHPSLSWFGEVINVSMPFPRDFAVRCLELG